MSDPHSAGYRTYLPFCQDAAAYQAIFEQDYEYFSTEILAQFAYERVGFDRLLAVLNDLKRMGLTPPASVLDVGCNIGLFSLGLATAGYQVTGIDNNIAADVQGVYPARILELADQLKKNLGLENVAFINTDVEDFLDEVSGKFEICLLLSVVHQWFGGYASSGEGEKSYANVELILQKLVSSISGVLYYEGPEEEPVIFDMGLSLPDWFVTTGLAAAAIPIATSVAANGQLRTVYRVEI